METSKAVNAFLDAKPDLSQRSREQYTLALQYLSRECPSMPERADQVRPVLNKLSTVWARDTHWRIWKAFFRWCNLEYDAVNPMPRVQRPRRPRVEMRALSPGELAKVYAAADKVRDKSIVALALDAGIRASEFAKLRKIDVGSDTIRIKGKGNKEMRVPISPETFYLLQMLTSKIELQDTIFKGWQGHTLTRSGVYKIVQKCMKLAKIQPPKLGPHCLRHSLGTNYIARGGNAFDLRRIMRHDSITTTQRYVNQAMDQIIDHHHLYSPLRDIIHGYQGVLIEQKEEILK